QRFPLAVQQLDHRLEVGILRLNLFGALAVAVDLFAAEEEVVALALALRRGDAAFERGDLFVDFLEALVALALFGAERRRPRRLARRRLGDGGRRDGALPAGRKP